LDAAGYVAVVNIKAGNDASSEHRTN